MSDLTLTELQRLITERTGHLLRSGNEARLLAYVKNRLCDYQDSLAHYTLALVMDSDMSGPEWQGLIHTLTNTESFFFRDEGVYLLLKQQILPKLIQMNRSSRQLKIWSAGCSRGEELFSIAILLDQLGPELEHWDVQLLGTDINLQVIQQARRGCFTPWSLRTVSNPIKSQYFESVGEAYQLQRSIVNKAQFELFNLSTPLKKGSQELVCDVDLILCRNVFIYLCDDAIKTAVEHFQRAMKPGGLLITGHSELTHLNLTSLVAKPYPGALVFEKGPKEEKAAFNAPIPPTPHSLKPVLHNNPVMTEATVELDDGKLSPLTVAQQAFNRCDYEKTITVLNDLVSGSGVKYDQALQLKAQALASLGRYTEAKEAINAAIACNDLCGQYYYLLAMILQLSGDRDAAIKQLQNAIYLDDQFIPAYIELAAFLEEAGRFNRSLQLRKTAYALLASRTPNETIDPYPLQAKELKIYLKALLAEKPATLSETGVHV